MKDYKDFTHYIEYVNANKLYEAKIELTNMIILLNGDFQKISEAIAYAKANSDFDFEPHEPSRPNIPLDTNEDKFTYEKGKLLDNFSKERLDEVIKLYPLMCEEKGNSENPELEKDSEVDENNTLKKIAIVGGVVIGAYLLYQLLK